MDTILKKICGDPNLPLNSERPWDARKAIINMRKKASSDGSGDKDKMDWKAYGKGFVYVDPDNADSFGGYKLPFADVINGKLTAIWRGVVAAMVAVKGGRGGLNIPETERKKSFNFLVGYYKRFKKEVPEYKNYEEDVIYELANIKKSQLPTAGMNVVLKRDDEKQIVYGAVLVPEVIDLQGEVISEEDIEKAAHDYMIRSRNIDVMHSKNVTCYVVESYIAPSDIEINGSIVKKGTWIMGVYVPDKDVWTQVRMGKLKGFSIYGLANTEPADIEEDTDANT